MISATGGSIVGVTIHSDFLKESDSKGDEQDIGRTLMRDDGFWHDIEIVTTETDGCSTDWHPGEDICVDNEGKVHVTWTDHEQQIYYKYKQKGGTWSGTDYVSTSEEVYIPAHPVIDTDIQGNVHIAWLCSYWDDDEGKEQRDIFYRCKKKSGGWSQVELVSTESKTKYNSYPILDVVDNVVYISWHGEIYEDKAGILFKSKQVDGTWPTGSGASEIVHSITEEYYPYGPPTIVVDSQGTVHCCFLGWRKEPYDLEIFYKNKTKTGSWGSGAESWEFVTDTESGKYCDAHPRLAVDSNDNLHIIYKISTGGGSPGSMYYKMKDYGECWPLDEGSAEKFGVYSPDYDESEYDISISDNMIHVVYIGPNGDIMYNYKEIEKTWIAPEEKVGDSSWTYGWNLPRVASDSDGRVHVIWSTLWEDDNDSYLDVFYRMRSEPYSWTIMVYQAADNNLEGAIIDDFLEMAKVGSCNNINITVLLDRTPTHDTRFGDWTNTRRGIVMKGDEPWNESCSDPKKVWGESVGEKNMGDPTTLIEFIEWSMSTCPASKYALILEDHGLGWLPRDDFPYTRGACWDDTNGSDYLSTKEFGDVLRAIDEHIDLIGFDACLMAMIECAYEIVGESSVYVASEKEEPGNGWNYTLIMTNLCAHPEWNAKELGINIVDCFAQSYPLDDVSLAAFDLDAIGGAGLAGGMSNLADTIMDIVDYYGYKRLESHRVASPYYEHEWIADPHDYRDLGTFLAFVIQDTKLHSWIRDAADNALKQYFGSLLNSFVYPSGTGTGMSIYFQKAGDPPEPKYIDNHLRFCADTQWDEFLVWWQNGPPLKGDITGDGVVDVLDLQAVIGAWGLIGDPGWIAEDVIEDGVVDVLDLQQVLFDWT